MTTDAQPEPAGKPTAKPRAKRRWYQFSLWSMMVWVTVIGVGLTVWLRWVAPIQQQRRAVLMVEELGGSLEYADPPASESSLFGWLRERFPRYCFDDVVRINLRGTQVTDFELVHLTGLKALEGLFISGNQVTDTGLVHLQALTALRWLHLDDTQVTNAGLAHLRSLTSLEFLKLDNTQVSDAGLKHLTGLTTLRRLNLNYTQVTDAGLANLQGLTALQYLDLDKTQVTYAGLREFRKALPNCRIYH